MQSKAESVREPRAETYPATSRVGSCRARPGCLGTPTAHGVVLPPALHSRAVVHLTLCVECVAPAAARGAMPHSGPPVRRMTATATLGRSAPTNSCGGSYCTSCREALSGFASLGFWRIDAAPANLPLRRRLLASHSTRAPESSAGAPAASWPCPRCRGRMVLT
jgi:hypothetical protein